MRDPPAHTLPPNAWTSGQNVRFVDGVAMPTGRDVRTLGPLQVAPYWLHYNVINWTYVGDNGDNTMGAWAVDTSQTHTNLVSGVQPNWTAESRVTGGNINGLVTINNKTDTPVYWDGANPVTSKLVHLPWDATNSWNDVSWRANSIRPHKRWLFALGMIEGSATYPQRIRNSASAPPGAIPATWDDADATADAAFVDDPASDLYAFIDGSSMGDEFCAYTAQTTWIGQATGNNDAPFRFRKAFDFVGTLSTDCVAAQGRRQFLLTQDDVVTHDGSSVQSVLRENSRRWLFRNIDTDAVDACFIFYARTTNELMVCFPEQGALHCTKALVINLNDNSRIGIREIPELRAIDMGSDFPGVTVLDFDSANFTYGQSTFPYSQVTVASDTEDRFGVSPTDLTGLICMKNYANVVSPHVPTARLERSHMTFPGEQRPALQDGRILRCTAVYPTFSRQPDGDMDVYLGTSNSSGGDMTWHGPQKYNAKTTRNGRVNFRAQGRYLGVRFETTDGADWQLSGYDMDIQPLGHRA